MPQAVALWAASAFAGTTYATAGAALTASLATAAVYVTAFAATTAAIAYGTSQLSKPRGGGNIAAFGDQSRSVMIRDSFTARRKIYGAILTSGLMYPIGVSGTKNEDFHFAVVYAAHQVDQIGDLYFGTELIPLDGGAGGDATNRFGTFVHMGPHDGAPWQAVDAALNGAFPVDWDTNHIGTGIAYDAVRLRVSPDLFPSGLPTIKRLIRGAIVYDPRDVTQDQNDPTTWKWSANAALCAADYIHDPYFGKGVPWSRINMTALIEAANICDETIVLTTMVVGDLIIGQTYTIAVAGSTNFTLIGAANNTVGTSFVATGIGSGTGEVAIGPSLTEARYTTNGTTTADQDKSQVLSDLADAMAGKIIDSGGYWTIRAGAARSYTITLGDGDLAGPVSVQPRMSRQDTYNGVKGGFISPINLWQLADFPGVKNDTYKAADGDVRIWKDISLNFTISSATAQRIAKVDLERGRQQITYSALYKLSALDAIPSDIARINRPSLGWTNKLFEITRWELKTYEAGGGTCLGVELTFRETAAGVWDWNNGEETVDDLAPNTDLPNPNSVPTPTGLTLLSDSTTAFQQADGTFVPRLKVSWNSPNNIYVEQGGQALEEYKKHSDSNWLSWNPVNGDLTEDFITDVKGGTAYDVRVQFRNSIGVRGPYATVSNYTVNSDVVAPANVTGLAATALVDSVQLAWTNPTDTDFSHVEIYYSTSSTAPSSGTPATIKAGKTTLKIITNLTAGTLYYFYVRTRDLTGNPSAYSSAVTATPLAISSYVAGAIASAGGSGNFNYYAGTAPSGGGLRVGDLWFDTSDGFKVYHWTGSAWSSVQDTRIGTLQTGLSTTQGDVTTLQSNLTTEISARTSGDSSLAASISSEASARSSADGTLTTNLSTEVSARISAVSSEAGTRASADTTLAASVTTESTARASADGSLAAEYVLEVSAGNRVAGFRITTLGGGGGGSDFVIQADKFGMVNTSGSGAKYPFLIDSGIVWLDDAVIRALDAGKISTGTLNAALSLGAGASFHNGGSGAYEFFADTSGVRFGDASGKHFEFINRSGATSLAMYDGGTLAGFLDLSSGSITLDLGSGGDIYSAGIRCQSMQAFDWATVQNGLRVGSLDMQTGAIYSNNGGPTAPFKDASGNYIQFQWSGSTLYGIIDFGAATVALN